MSELLTRIILPGQKTWSGLSDWGRKDAAEMVRLARSYAEHLRAQAEEIERALDGDFQIDVVRGAHAQRHVSEVQASRLRPAKREPQSKEGRAVL